MGLGPSTQLNPAFTTIAAWPWSRATAMADDYVNEEFDFGIDYHVVAQLTRLSTDDAKAIVTSLAKSETGIINALTLLIGVCCLAESGERNADTRAAKVFDIMDFDGVGQISVDELTIMLFCLSSALGSILNRKAEAASDAVLSRLTAELFEALGKKASGSISKTEFLGWAKRCIATLPEVHIESLFNALCTGSFHEITAESTPSAIGNMASAAKDESST